MRTGMRRIYLLMRLIILVAYFAMQPQNALAATVHVIAGKGVSGVLANEFGAITTEVLQFYEQVYNYSPANSVSILIVADEPLFVQRLQLEGYSQEEAARIGKVSAGIFLNSKITDSTNVRVSYSLSRGKLNYENPVIIICANKNTSYLPRIRTVAHEMFHLMQRELKGNTPAHEWLAEGSAKVSEFVLLEWLGKGSLASRHHNLINNLVNVKLKADPHDLKNGGTRWIKLMEENMYPYQVSESMTEYLIGQVGKPPIIRYFALIGETHDRNAAFHKAFGMDYAQFVEGYKAYMKQEAAAAGRIKLAVEGEIAPEVVQMLNKHSAAVEQMLRNQGWAMTKSQRFTLVPNTDMMLKVMRRELPEINEGRLAGMARSGPIAAIGELDFVYDIGKTSASNRDYPLTLIVCRGSIIMTAQPASAMNVYWLFEGTTQYLTAMAAEAAGGKSVVDSRKEWMRTIRKSAGYPTLTQMNSSLTAPAVSRYRGEVISATVALAADYLAEKTKPEALLRYFTVLRDLNDGPRAFQQVFGMSIEAFDTDFAAYINTQKENAD